MINHDHENKTIYLSGSLDFDSADATWAQLKPTLDKHSVLILDLQYIKKVDSAGIALLLAAVRLYKKSGQRLNFKNIPPSLVAYATACNVRDLLAI